MPSWFTRLQPLLPNLNFRLQEWVLGVLGIKQAVVVSGHFVSVPVGSIWLPSELELSSTSDWATEPLSHCPGTLHLALMVLEMELGAGWLLLSAERNFPGKA